MAQNRPLELTVTGSPLCNMVYMSHGTGRLKPEETDVMFTVHRHTGQDLTVQCKAKHFLCPPENKRSLSITLTFSILKSTISPAFLCCWTLFPSYLSSVASVSFISLFAKKYSWCASGFNFRPYNFLFCTILLIKCRNIFLCSILWHLVFILLQKVIYNLHHSMSARGKVIKLTYKSRYSNNGSNNK